MNTPRQTKADLAYTQLRKNILTGKLQPGSMLLENKLCDEFNISRTPIRTALQRLVYENFVDYIPEKGMFVSQIKFIDILEIAEVRIPLECLAVRLATARMTDEDLNELGNSLAQHRAAMEADDAEAVFEHDNDFHRFIAKGSKNDKLYAICLDLINQSARGSYLTLHDKDRISTAIAEHTAAYEAICRRDAEAAAKCLKAHLSSWVEYTKNEQINNFYIYK